MKQEDSPLQTSIGNYTVKKKIATGGMGEIYLVYDRFCDRYICLKKIREDRLQYPTLKDRFLREAKIASQMTHPCIIPIYNIHTDDCELYYTMPHIEGETLKQILKQSLEQEKTGKIIHPIGSSIHALLRIFINVCQAIAYCHSRGVLHRDIKPENIIVGKFGETLILDWGLADFVNDPLQESNEKFPVIEQVDLTKPGKVPGTLAYIPPERVFGKPSSYATDIYALGVVLYQLLTLKLPFHRTSKEKLKKQIQKEQLVDPIDRSPYRDIPLELSRITKKCLNPDPDMRYNSVNELLSEIEYFISGKGTWLLTEPVDVARKKDWEFQENFLVAKHSAITPSTGAFEWVTMMISKKGVNDNFQLETFVELKEQSQGVGFLLNIPEIQERKGILQDGNYIWIGSKNTPGCFLFRSNVRVMSIPDIVLEPLKKYKIRIEKVDCHMRLLIDDKPTVDYLTQIPLSGPHFGIVLKDDELNIDPIKVSISSPNIMINCLKIPDLFFSSNNLPKALTEYRKIRDSFPGRMEGREALFRAGITLLEIANKSKNKKQRDLYYLQALEEFEKLRITPSAPLEYLGKSLVYKANNEIDEEIKCLDLSLRKYTNHPLKYLIEEELVFRFHEAAYQDRIATYHFALLCLRHIPNIFHEPEHKLLFDSLAKGITPLVFLENIKELSLQDYLIDISIRLSFLLCRPHLLIEIIKSTDNVHLINNGLLCLLYLGFPEIAQEELDRLSTHPELTDPIQKAIYYLTKKQKTNDLLTHFKNNKSSQVDRVILLLCEKNKLPLEELLHADLLHSPNKAYSIWNLIQKKDYKTANEELDSHPELDAQIYNFFKACLICHDKGIDKALSFLQEHKSHLLFDNLFVEKEGNPSAKDIEKLFEYEKIQFFKEALLLTQSCEKDVEANKWKKLLQKQYRNV
ncbi:MAG: serine/threonine protein kinase [Chlamydiae bacterium]|nr:serine/threonine protein kinase [Chlamydiota bacterium]